MKPKIIFFDIDWTLYDHKNHEWNMPSIEAIRQTQKQGIKLIVCTARPYHSAYNLGIESLGIKWDGWISSAGGVACAEGNYIYKTLIPRPIVERFLKFVKERGIAAELVEVLTRKLVSKGDGAEAFYNGFVEVRPEEGEYEGEEVIGFNMFATSEIDDEFQKEFPELLYFRYFDNGVDITYEPHEKGVAIDHILDYFGFTKDDAMGFGDDIQDISIAEHVKTFVCLGNGKDEVKKVATYVTDNIWDNGVKNALIHFGLAL
ncbi:MAG: HAD-IIB family hydrolase [Bacilli bacterium]|nr:HAD-IIB family hydrolase [Bacilli bacterium]